MEFTFRQHSPVLCRPFLPFGYSKCHHGLTQSLNLPVIFAASKNLFVMTIDDLLNMLQYWLQPVTKASEMYNLNGDGLISTSDLLLLLGQLI